MKEILLGLHFYIVAVHPVLSQSEAFFDCAAKQGCHISQCDPMPNALRKPGMEEDSNRNDFPITCKVSKDICAADLHKIVGELREEMQKEIADLRKFQEKSLKEMKDQLDAAEHSLIELLQNKHLSDLSSPRCKEPEVDFANVTCSDVSYKAGTVCRVLCHENRVLKGASILTCTTNGEWSHKLPTCKCRGCRTGENCEHGISWRNIKNRLNGDATFNFGGNDVLCDSEFYIDNWKLRWKCKCTDMGTRISTTCLGYSSSKGSCEHAGAELVRQMMAKHIYPTPCDMNSLTVGCS